MYRWASHELQLHTSHWQCRWPLYVDTPSIYQLCGLCEAITSKVMPSGFICIDSVSSGFEHFFIDSNLENVRFLTHFFAIFSLMDVATLLWIKSGHTVFSKYYSFIYDVQRYSNVFSLLSFFTYMYIFIKIFNLTQLLLLYICF